MMKAYDASYLYDAVRNLADATDYAVNYRKIPIKEFFEYFTISGIAKQFADGNPKYTVGMSGMDMADAAIEKVGIKEKLRVKSPYSQDLQKSREYWTGWIMAYWQWSTDRSFSEMLKFFPAEKIRDMYNVYHEVDEDKFVEDVEDIIAKREAEMPTKLAHMRGINGLSQSELAAKAEVNIRNIQQYEQRKKDIKKASVETVMRLAKALNCDIRDVI